jgi:hypothetical protein
MNRAPTDLLLCMVLTFVMLTGIVFIPLLVHCDMERWRRCEDKLPDG